MSLRHLKEKFTGDRSSSIVSDTNIKDRQVAQDAASPLIMNTGITPYLGLNARLSQTWINRWTILLLLVLARLLIAIVSLNEDIGSAKREALSACTSVESVGSAMASMPHYLAAGVNELTATGVEKAIDGLMEMLTLTITGVEELTVFYINMLTSTYVCLITLVVAGSLHVAVALIEDITSFLNTTLTTIGNDIQGSITDFETDLNKIIASVDDALKLVGTSIAIPTLDVNTSIAALHDLEIPTSFNTELQTLNNEIPTFAEVNNLTNTALRWPFEEVKKLIANHTSNYTFDRSLFPVPAKETLSFCSDNNDIGKFFDGLVETAITARKVALVVLCLLATIVCVPMAYREIRSWRTMKQRAQLINTGTYDSMDITYIVSRPYTATAGIQLANKFHTTRRQALVRWVLAYATTIPALFVLCLGLAGLFSCLCQYIILKAVEREVPNLETEITNFADKVVDALEDASNQWQNGTNSAILDLQKKINNDLFHWVNISAVGLNDTLNVFVDESIKVLNFTFGGTILYTPVTELFECLIGLKVAGIEKGLTWVSDHAYIDFPLLPNNTFSVGAASSLNNSSPSESFLAAGQNGTADAISSAVESLVTKLQNGIRMEVIISSFVVLLWVVILLMGVFRALFLWFGHDDEFGARRLSFAHSDMHANPEDPFTDDNHVNTDEKRLNKDIPMVVLPSKDNTTQGNPYVNPYVYDDNQFDNSGDHYRGTAYTLKQTPFPAPRLQRPEHGENQPQSEPVNESLNLRYAGAREVGGAVKRPHHFRMSSHAALGGVK